MRIVAAGTSICAMAWNATWSSEHDEAGAPRWHSSPRSGTQLAGEALVLRLDGRDVDGAALPLPDDVDDNVHSSDAEWFSVERPDEEFSRRLEKST